jgi:glycosyltransferase involved in cell wall biosynthesis
MNILLINHYAGSPKHGMEFRSYYLAREWLKMGHNTTIIAASFSHLRTEQPIIQNDIQRESIEGITYLWLKTPKYHSSGIYRVLNILSFVLKLLIFNKRITENTNPDIVINSSTYPLDIFPGYIIARKYKAKLIFELHDLWPLSPMLIGGYSKWSPFIWFMQRAENFACRKSNFYISLLPNVKDYLIKHGLSPEKLYFIPNGYSDDDVRQNPGNILIEYETLFNKLKAEYKFLIGYIGGHSASNALKSYVTSLEHYIHDNNIAFVLIGEGPQKAELKESVDLRSQQNIFFLPGLPKDTIHSVIENFDVLFAGGTKGPLHKYGTSFNKLIDYMLAKKPIIFSVDEPNSLISRIGCGIQISAENKVELIKAIDGMRSLSKSELKEMGEKGYAYTLAELNYKSLADKFIRIVQQ